MKFIRSVSIVMILFISGCVAKKKYESVEAELAKYKVNDSFQEAQIATEKYEKSDINLDLKRQVSTLKLKVDSLQNIIGDLNRKLDDCEK